MLKYIIDIDNTLCTLARPGHYDTASPISRNIDKVNALYDKGHEICIWTARGTTTGEAWFELTQKQLFEWGVKYHELRMGKPYYDVWVDDKAVRIEEL